MAAVGLPTLFFSLIQQARLNHRHNEWHKLTDSSDGIGSKHKGCEVQNIKVVNAVYFMCFCVDVIFKQIVIAIQQLHRQCNQHHHFVTISSTVLELALFNVSSASFFL